MACPVVCLSGKMEKPAVAEAIAPRKTLIEINAERAAARGQVAGLTIDGTPVCEQARAMEADRLAKPGDRFA